VVRLGRQDSPRHGHHNPHDDREGNGRIRRGSWLASTTKPSSEDAPAKTPSRRELMESILSHPSHRIFTEGSMSSEISMNQFCDILSGGAPKPTGPRSFDLGFSFDPGRGHKLVVPAKHVAGLENAIRARLVVRGSSTLVFAIDLRVQDNAGYPDDWSEVTTTVHIPHKDQGHVAALANCESHILPPSALALELVAVDDLGKAIARKRCDLTFDIFRNINSRVQRAQNTSYRQWQVDQGIAMIQLRRESPTEIHEATIDLRDVD
jgi:hypothetical protein